MQAVFDFLIAAITALVMTAAAVVGVQIEPSASEPAVVRKVPVSAPAVVPADSLARAQAIPC